MNSQPPRETSSPLNMFSSTLSNPINNQTNDSFFSQPRTQLMPTRLPPPKSTITTSQSPLTLKKLNIHKNEVVTDLLDFSDPTPPPESPKFDPYA
jgi:hypothetical protein